MKHKFINWCKQFFDTPETIASCIVFGFIFIVYVVGFTYIFTHR